jgi:hypothetical protein
MRHLLPVVMVVAISGLSSRPLAAAVEEPTVDEVHQAATQGDIERAKTMINLVLRNHPISAKANFVGAEVYTLANQLNVASVLLRKAKNFDPAYGSFNVQALVELEEQLADAARAAPAPGKSVTQTSGAAYDKCIKYQRGTAADATPAFVNTCGERLTLAFWIDGKNADIEGLCVDRPARCSESIAPNAKEIEFAYTGVIHIAACKFPDAPFDDGSNTLRCPQAASGSH